MRPSPAISIRLLDQLIDERALLAFADKYGFLVSKPLIDADISQIPGTKGLNGKFSEQAYQQFLAQQRLTDVQVREVISADLLQRLMLTPIATNTRVPGRGGDALCLDAARSPRGRRRDRPDRPLSRPGSSRPTPTSSASMPPIAPATWSPSNARCASPGSVPTQVAGVAASDQEIAAYYNANQATYGAKETRNLSQAVVPDQATANAIAARAKAGGTLAAAAAPAGANAAVTSLPDQSRQAYAAVAGDKPAGGGVRGAVGSGRRADPVGLRLGRREGRLGQVAKAASRLPRRTREIAAKLTADKRKAALEDLVDKVQNAIDDGSNFAEAAAAGQADGDDHAADHGRRNVARRPGLPASRRSSRRCCKTGFEIAANDPPEIVALAERRGLCDGLAGAGRRRRPRPARHHPRPGRERLDQPAGDAQRAQAVADRDRRQGSRAACRWPRRSSEAGMPVAAGSPAGRPADPDRRRQGARCRRRSRLLFTLGQGKSRMVAGPAGARLFRGQGQQDRPRQCACSAEPDRPDAEGVRSRPRRQEYAQQFVAAVRADMKVKRNESAIQARRQRIVSSGS